MEDGKRRNEYKGKRKLQKRNAEAKIGTTGKDYWEEG